MFKRRVTGAIMSDDESTYEDEQEEYEEGESALDGFGGSSYDDIIEALSELVDDEGGLSNFISSGDMKSTVDKMLDEAALNFIGLDLETGAILSAIAGNTIFNVGGRDNALSNIGKIILDNIISGKFKKDVQPFVPPGGGKTGLNFYEERKKCLSNKVLFEDPEFPATDRSISNEEIGEKIEWKRPSEIVEDPQFIVGQTSRFDVKQNALGDCWLLAAIANLTLRDELFFRVVPPDQSFTQDYAGIFHFHFWRYGKWVDVVIDDRLPMLNGKLYSLHSQENNEFWSALLEKAYAKLYGSYENLEGGFTAEALEDFTGGLTESYILRNTEKSILLAVMANPNEDENAESVMDNGLVFGHAYSVTALILVKDSSQGNNLLVRIRNPWGDTEWNGAWSDDSPEWNAVDSKERAQLKVSVCELQKHQWEEHAQDGDWNMAKGTAGGNLSNPDTFAKNPQFGARFIVSEDSVEKDGKCTVIVAVLQKYRREMRPAGKENLEIGFYVYEDDLRAKGAAHADFLLDAEAVVETNPFSGRRQPSSMMCKLWTATFQKIDLIQLRNSSDVA
ncbi:calpain family cysteine protease [Ancylostoma ceylanicum]|uniref:Calpain family cysteine protease n=1 Tax=Ancylostoma ceylanicum TaxID=53326 RepID=A0A0D6LWY6_9BILA|nr:calpain family cysteine protease [Ancylostoma ceylanicum]